MLETFLIIIRVGYVAVFFLAMFIYLKFEWGAEGKDERGKSIANKSYSIVFPFMPLGWLCIELYDQYIAALDYTAYKLSIWFLVTGLIIVHALVISILKRRY